MLPLAIGSRLGLREDGPVTTPAPLFGDADLDVLRAALADFTTDEVHDTLGPIGRAAQERGDVTGAERELPADDDLATLVRLFLLGLPVPQAEAASVLGDLSDAGRALLLDPGPEPGEDRVRARLEIRPYGEDARVDWWVVSDFGSDVRPGPLADDHVLGIGGASLNLAQATIREPVESALDIGTGCGIQALHLARHAQRVVATDLSLRALRLAATTAALSGTAWELRQGSLLEPVTGQTYDQIVANPPFVVSPGWARGTGGHDYRDSGLSGDEVSRTLLDGIPRLLRPGGSATLLANWIVPPDGDWAGRVGGWLEGSRCDAWVWQREVLGPGEYVSLWLRDAGELPGTERWRASYEQWVRWFEHHGIPAVGMGLVTLWRTEAAEIIRCEDVPQAVQQPAGAHLPAWLHRQRWLATHTDDALLGSRLTACRDLIRERNDVHSPHGWTPATVRLRQSHGARWELDSDDSIAALVGACTGEVPLRLVLDVLAATLDAATDEVTAAAVPVVRDLVARGFLEPPAGQR